MALAAGLVIGEGAAVMLADRGAQALAHGTRWRAMAETPAPAVVLSCTDLSEVACAGLEAALTAHLGTPPARTAPGPAALTVTLVMTREDSRVLAGRLVWQRGPAAPETGPVIQTIVTDTVVKAETYTRFAKAVLRASPVPF